MLTKCCQGAPNNWNIWLNDNAKVGPRILRGGPYIPGLLACDSHVKCGPWWFILHSFEAVYDIKGDMRKMTMLPLYLYRCCCSMIGGLQY